MEQARSFHKDVVSELPTEAQYAVPRSFRVRWYMKMNLREVYHIVELRSSRQGHPDYRDIAQRMLTLVASVLPELSEFIMADMNQYDLPRLESEKRLDQKTKDVRDKLAP